MNRSVDFVDADERPPPTQPDDPKVVRAASGDSRAFECLLIEVALPVFRSTAFKHRSFLRTLRPVTDTEDFVQTCVETLIAAFRKLTSDRKSLLRERNRAGFAAYARRLATRKLTELNRHRWAFKRGGNHDRIKLDLDVACLILHSKNASTPHATAYIRVETGLRLRDALEALPAADRLMLKLRFENELKYTDIAEQCGKSASACRTRMTRIIKALKNTLQA